MAALSYPDEGNPKPDAVTFLRDIPSIRSAFLDTPPAIMLALDYLLKRPDVDPPVSGRHILADRETIKKLGSIVMTRVRSGPTP